jgi:hypothetical protein
MIYGRVKGLTGKELEAEVNEALELVCSSLFYFVLFYRNKNEEGGRRERGRVILLFFVYSVLFFMLFPF